jgi:UDP-glucuronate 4-epimerase
MSAVDQTEENPSAKTGTYLVTGAAGFIGFHATCRLLEQGIEVVGLDNLNDYYDPALKQARLDEIARVSSRTGTRFDFVKADLADKSAVDACFNSHHFSRVIHLAAQAGVRHSIEAPDEYVSSNLVGFANILEACRNAKTPHLAYASTSSVYGANDDTPYSEHRGADHPLQLYAATKRANELMAHAYSHLYNIPTTALRFFTVYGPWGRPDMALFLFTEKILKGEPIPIYNEGQLERDFTYVDDIVEGVLRVAADVAKPNPKWDARSPDPATSSAPFRILNIGNNEPVPLLDFIDALEDVLGKKAIRDLLPMQPGDVKRTHADVSLLKSAVNYNPTTSVREGVGRFVDWYRAFYGVPGNTNDV